MTRSVIVYGSGLLDKLVVQQEEDGVLVAEGPEDACFIPDSAVRPLIRLLEEYEERRRGRAAWGR